MRAADSGWRRLIDHLAVPGPADIDDLRVELRLSTPAGLRDLAVQGPGRRTATV